MNNEADCCTMRDVRNFSTTQWYEDKAGGREGGREGGIVNFDRLIIPSILLPSPSPSLPAPSYACRENLLATRFTPWGGKQIGRTIASFYTEGKEEGREGRKDYARKRKTRRRKSHFFLRNHQLQRPQYPLRKH